MGCVVVDLEGCSGTEPPHVMVSRATSMNGLFVLRGFGMKQITKWRSEELRNEFLRLKLSKMEDCVEVWIRRRSRKREANHGRSVEK